MSGQAWRVVAVSVLVAGLGGSMPARPAAAATARVDMADQRFDPPRLEISLGDYVRWEALDDDHTVTARDGTFDSSSRGVMVEGDEYRYRFRAAGAYDYFCRVHASRGMVGQIVVVDPYAPTTSTTRLVTPVTAAATTTTAPTTTTTAPATTTSRVLATSSTTSPSVATSTTAPAGAPAAPQEPPTLNPGAPVVGSADSDASLPGAQAAARRAQSSDDLLSIVALGVVALLALFGGVVGIRARRHRPSG